MGVQRNRRIVAAISQVLVHRRPINDLARIEQTFRIKGALDIAEGRVQRVAIHVAQKLRAQQAITVFTRQRTTILDHQVAHSLGDATHFCHIFGLLQIEQRASMHQPNRGMAIERHFHALVMANLAKRP